MKEYSIPYSNQTIPVLLPEDQVAFVGNLPRVHPIENWQEMLYSQLDHPTAGPALKDLLPGRRQILVLVEDNTRHTPVRDILPVLCRYLTDHGCTLDQVEILIAPGTHRMMTQEELLEKLGPFAMEQLTVSQHDWRDMDALVEMEDVWIGDMRVPVTVNRKAAQADLLIGLGSIIPHPNAGYSGGAKILDPGCCGPKTVSATHVAAALMGTLPLGMEENPCRAGLEQVAQAAGLAFLINVVLDADNQVAGLVTGDVVRAHRAGARLSRNVFGVPVKEPADILISCSYPYDIDYWQCEKAMITGYFAVKEGGILILAAPCLEGMAHNHDGLLEWLELDSQTIAARIRAIQASGSGGDLVAASIAMGAVTVKEKARIFLYSTGLSPKEVERMGYRGFDSLQAAIDAALAEIPGGRIGILPRGGDCLPYQPT